MRVLFHVGVHKTGSTLLQQNIRNNRRRLLGQGIFCANVGFPEIRTHQMWLQRRLEGPDSRGRPALNTLANINGRMIKAAHAAGAHSILFSHEDRIGYAPYAKFVHGAKTADFYPQADLNMRYMLNGLPHSRTTLLLYTRRQESLVPSLFSEGARNIALPFDLDEFATRINAETFRFSDLVRRLQSALPEVSLQVRAFEDVKTDAREFVATFFRDIGANPRALRINTNQINTALDKGQCDELVELARERMKNQRPLGELRRAAKAITERPSDPMLELHLPPAEAARLRQIADEDSLSLNKALDPGPLVIFFMVEPGPLELQARLLVNSLLVNCQDDMRLIGFCREALIRDLNHETCAFLEKNGVELRPLINDFADSYPAGNKLIASGSVQAPGWAMFMDTDMMLMRPSSFLKETSPKRVSVCLDTVNGWSDDEQQWAALYSALHLKPPKRKIRLHDGVDSFPIYNAGLVLFPPPSRGGTDFGQIWLDSARRIERDDTVARKRPWLDTIALAASIDRDDAPDLRLLDVDWNCTTRLAKETTRVVHYHGIRQLFEYRLNEDVNTILAQSNDNFHQLGPLIDHYRNDLRIEGDIRRRAMRHGLMNNKKASP